MPAVSISPQPKLQFFDANGNPLSGGKLYSYDAGTTTPRATYTDSTGNVANANPVILDTRGEASVWMDSGYYKLALYTSTNVLVWTVDNVGGNVSLAQLAASGGSALVGFLQAGTNAQPRTVQSKLRDVVSVKDFGAVGNGVADDTAAIQAAINASYSVYLPQGTYRVTTLYIPYDRQIFGDARNNTFIYSTSNQPIINLGAPSSAKTQMFNFSIKGNNNPAFTNQHGLHFPATANSGVYDCVFENMEITECGGNGIDLRFAATPNSGAFYNIFQNLKVHFNLGYGANFQGGLFNGDTFINCVFNSNRLGGVYYHSMASQTQEQKFIGCFFEANGNGAASAFGIWVNQARSMLSVENTFIEANGVGNAGFTSWGIRIKEPTYLELKGNTFAANGQYHIWIDGMDTGVYVDIEGNLIAYDTVNLPNTAAGVFLDACYKGLVNFTGNNSDIPENLRIVRGSFSSTPVIQNRIFQAVNTIDSESMVKNGAFSTSAANWDPEDATLASVAGGASGNCLQITRTSGSFQSASQTTNLVGGRLYKLSFAIKSGTSGNEAFAVLDSITVGFVVTGVTTPDWVTHELVFRAIGSVQSIVLRKATATAGTMLFDNVSIVEVADELNSSVALAVAGTGGLARVASGYYFATVTASASVTMPINIPAGRRIIGVQIIVSSALAAGDTWTAKLNDGVDIETITTTGAVAKNTKVDYMTNLITDATTNIVFTRSGGGSFTAQGTLAAVVYTEQLVALPSIP